MGSPRLTTMAVGASAVPTCWTKPLEGGEEASEVPFRKMESPAVQVQAGLVTRPEVMTWPEEPLLMAAVDTPSTRPKLCEGFELSATFPVEVTGEKAGMFMAAVTAWATLPEGTGGAGGRIPSLAWAWERFHTRKGPPSRIIAS